MHFSFKRLPAEIILKSCRLCHLNVMPLYISFRSLDKKFVKCNVKFYITTLSRSLEIKSSACLQFGV